MRFAPFFWDYGLNSCGVRRQFFAQFGEAFRGKEVSGFGLSSEETSAQQNDADEFAILEEHGPFGKRRGHLNQSVEFHHLAERVRCVLCSPIECRHHGGAWVDTHACLRAQGGERLSNGDLGPIVRSPGREAFHRPVRIPVGRGIGSSPTMRCS